MHTVTTDEFRIEGAFHGSEEIGSSANFVEIGSAYIINFNIFGQDGFKQVQITPVNPVAIIIFHPFDRFNLFK